MRRTILCVSTLAAAGMLRSLPAKATDPGPDVSPILVEGNPTCQDLGYDFGFKVDPPYSGTYALFPGGPSVTVTTDGTYFNWSSSFGVDAVISKGGPSANVYVYDPKDESFGDEWLHSPDCPSEEPCWLSHIDFCYDVNVAVEKTAETWFTREWNWTIDKWADKTALTLSTGQVMQVHYKVVVDAESADSGWKVSGNVSIHNPPFGVAANISAVTDIISDTSSPIGPDIAVPVNCPGGVPQALASGATLVCSYSAALPDGGSRLNTATVTTSGLVEGGWATAPVTFSDPTTEKDECIDVTDTLEGDLGTVCAGESLPHQFEYWLDVGPYATCGDFEVKNVASFKTNDSGWTDKDDWVVSVHVPCYGGCTLTQGYWKTHSEYGPAAHPDDTWEWLPDGPDTPFFKSGKTWYQVFWIAPKGNPYYLLAVQYMAAMLNILNEADSTPAVDAALAGAEELFLWNTPTSLDSTEKSKALAWAALLDQYNNGLVGPWHCSE